jgi:hypothetical protein
MVIWFNRTLTNNKCFGRELLSYRLAYRSLVSGGWTKLHFVADLEKSAYGICWLEESGYGTGVWWVAV